MPVLLLLLLLLPLLRTQVSFYTNPQNAMALRILNSSYGWINDLVSAKSNQTEFKQVGLSSFNNKI